MGDFVDKMSFEGLPSVLQNMLSAIMSEKGLTSFSTDSRGDKTTVILRFSSAKVSAIAESDRKTFTVKPPSRVLRDRNRAAQFNEVQKTRKQQQSQQEDQQISPFGLFLPTPPSRSLDCEMS